MNKYTECYVTETEDTASVDVLAFSCMLKIFDFSKKLNDACRSLMRKF